MPHQMVYTASSYREVIKAYIAANRGRRGYKTELARRAGCHLSYLSQVLGGKVELTEDQAANLAVFWEMSEAATERFLYLLKTDRAATPALRNFYRRRLETLKLHEDLLSVGAAEATVIDAADQAVYYSSWQYAAVHMLLSIPAYRDLQQVAARLKLKLPTVHRIVATLESLRLVERSGEGWKILNPSLFLPRGSPMSIISHINWRLKGIEQLQEKNEASLHFSSLYAISRIDFEAFRTKIVATAKEMQSLVANSEEEELVAFTFDLFPV